MACQARRATGGVWRRATTHASDASTVEGARRLVLIKPPGLRPSDRTEGFGEAVPGLRLRDQADSFGGATPGATGNAVDAYFPRALPAHVISLAVAADDADALRSALGGEVEPA
jgi:hypothetical protein